MLFNFLKKQKKLSEKKRVLETMVATLTISPDEKELYFQSLNVLSIEELENVYAKFSKFVEKIEIKEIQDIQKESFTTISWMRKKEAEEKLEEINSFSFLLHNI